MAEIKNPFADLYTGPPPIQQQACDCQCDCGCRGICDKDCMHITFEDDEWKCYGDPYDDFADECENCEESDCEYCEYDEKGSVVCGYGEDA